MDKEIKRVCIYVRKSREEETEDALNRQQAVLIDKCKQNNWEYELFKEVGSSQEFERPKLQLMLEQIKLFLFDAIIVADTDRLSRNVGHFAQIKEIIISSGCLVVTPTRIYDYSKDDDDFISDIESVLSKNEYQKIKRRLMRGVKQSARDGNWLGKKYPIGYTYNRETKRLETTNDAPIVRRIFDEYLSGSSTKDIAYKFTLENVVTSSSMLWSPSGISRILNNPAYKGVSVYGKTSRIGGKVIYNPEEEHIIVEDTHEAIVTREEWDRVQQIKKDKNSKPIPLGANKHKFSGLIKCGLCGRVHSFQTSRYKRKRISSCQTRHFRSENYSDYIICPNKGCNLEDFEKIFNDLFKKHLDKFEQYVDIIRQVKEKKKSSGQNNDIGSLTKNIKRIQQDIKRVQQGFIANIFTEDEAQTEIKRYNDQISHIEKQIEHIKVREDNSSVDYLEEILGKMYRFIDKGYLLEEKEENKILKELVDIIIYTRTKDDDNKMTLDVVWKNALSEEEILELMR